MKNTIPEIQAHNKLWLTLKNGEGILGDGKWRLMKKIEETGSISQAAEKLGISYRKAWGDLKKAEELLGFPFMVKIRGGHAGGSSVLTQQGIEFLKAYGRFRKTMERAMQRSFELFLNEISKPNA
jgi:molybdate transport system regulatory protein